MDLNELMGQLQSDLTRMVKESYNAPQTAMEHWAAFRAAIDWAEPWIQGLMATHVVLFVSFLLFRNSVDFQTAQFFLICVLVGFSEKINGYCAVHWRSFSKQNYFDEHGTFASALFSGPLLLIGFAQLINFLRLTSSALISAKRLELQAKGKGKTKKGKKVD